VRITICSSKSAHNVENSSLIAVSVLASPTGPLPRKYTQIHLSSNRYIAVMLYGTTNDASLSFHASFYSLQQVRINIVLESKLYLTSQVCGYVLVVSRARSRRLGALLLVYLWLVFALNLSITVLTGKCNS
jgi:hypothetical protein